jgi:hypothetical protein
VEETGNIRNSLQTTTLLDIEEFKFDVFVEMREKAES